MKLDLYSFKPFVFKNVIPVNSGSAPEPRSGHRIVCDEANLYSFGGYNPHISYVDEDGIVQNDLLPGADGMLFKELWKFSFASKTWKKLLCEESIPGDELASNAMVLAEQVILMVYGGTGIPFGINVSNNLYTYKLNSGGNMKLVDVTGYQPPKMYGQAIVLIGPFLYTVGGTTGFDFSTDIHRLNLISNKWETIYICNGINSTDPPGRYRHEVACDGTKIYILGGGTSVSVYGFEEIPAFNISSKTWEKIISNSDPLAPPPGIPAARRCHSCVQLPSNDLHPSAVFISGGYNGSDIYNDMWKLELQTMQWTLLSTCKLPRPVYFHSAAVTTSGHMYTFGGIEKNNNNTKRTADVHAAWLRIPKLSDMCWEAFLHYSINLKLESRDRLLEIGVPKHFVEQIM